MAERTKKGAVTIKKTPLVRYEISVPKLPITALPRSAKRVDRLYAALQKQLSHRVFCCLKGAALRRYHKKDAQKAPFSPLRLSLTHKVTQFGEGILSLYRDYEEENGRQAPVRVRRADNWNVYEGYPLSLDEFLPDKKKAAVLLLREAKERLRIMEAPQSDKDAEEAAPGAPVALETIGWYQPLEKQMKRRFKKEQYNLTPEGVLLFWQAGDLAPETETAGAGVEALIPYEALGMEKPALVRPVRRRLKEVFPKFVRSPV